MRRNYLNLLCTLSICAGLAGCGMGSTVGLSSKKAANPQSNGTLQMKTEAGYETVSMSSVQKVDVVLGDGSSNLQVVQKSFEGSQNAAQILNSLGLNHPQVGNPPSSAVTGEILLVYQDGSQETSRTLQILGSKYLVDTQYSNTYYTASISLDSSWLNSSSSGR